MDEKLEKYLKDMEDAITANPYADIVNIKLVKSIYYVGAHAQGVADKNAVYKVPTNDFQRQAVLDEALRALAAAEIKKEK